MQSQHLESYIFGDAQRWVLEKARPPMLFKCNQPQLVGVDGPTPNAASQLISPKLVAALWLLLMQLSPGGQCERVFPLQGPPLKR